MSEILPTIAGRAVSRIAETALHAGMNPQHRVRMVLEPGHWAEHDPFLLLAEDWFVRGTFGDHPHRGFETVTFVLEGEVEHRDNHGGRGVLRPGDAQWMTAGRGVVHSEEAGSAGAHTLQLWINLPASLKLSEPYYQDLRGSAMPIRTEDGARLRVFSGASGGVTSGTRTLQPITMVELELDAGARVIQDVAAQANAFVYLLEGSGRFGSGSTAARAGQVVWFAPLSGGGATEVAIAADERMRAMLWAGMPIREPVAAHGPFVMNTAEEVRQAFLDFQAGRF